MGRTIAVPRTAVTAAVTLLRSRRQRPLCHTRVRTPNRPRAPAAAPPPTGWKRRSRRCQRRTRTTGRTRCHRLASPRHQSPTSLRFGQSWDAPRSPSPSRSCWQQQTPAAARLLPSDRGRLSLISLPALIQISPPCHRAVRAASSTIPCDGVITTKRSPITQGLLWYGGKRSVSRLESDEVRT